MRKFLGILFLWFTGGSLLLLYCLTQLVKVESSPLARIKKEIYFGAGIDNVKAELLQIPVPAPASDIRYTALSKFLEDINSPLLPAVADLIKEADLYGLDYALMPAISMQESAGCKKIPENSFNCWGFGIYGTKVTRFASFPEAIAKVAKTIKEAYIKNGLTNATLVEDRWTPSSRGQWSYSVNYYINKIHEYEKQVSSS